MALPWTLGCAAAPLGAPPVPVPISRIQGTSHLSPMTGQDVVTAGVVTVVTGDGFYLQDPVGDGEPATADGIFVEAIGQTSVRVGDRVRLRGTVAEAASPGSAEGLHVTRVVQRSAVEVISRNHRMPQPVVLGPTGRAIPRTMAISPSELPVDLRDTAQVRRNRFNPDADVLDFFESLEGMLVTLPSATALSPIERRSGGRSDFFAAPDVAHGRPRTAAGGLLLRSGADNLGDQNFDRLRIAFDTMLSGAPAPVLATGDLTGSITGVMDYAHGAFQVRPTVPVVVAARSRWRPEISALTRAPGHLTIAAYNVLNLSAAASDERQRSRLAGQIVTALRAPDILALQEIQDSSGERDDGVVDGRPTLRALAMAVLEAGGPGYAYVEVAPADGRPGGAPGGNIRNAFLYDTARVRLLGHRALTPDLLAAAGAPESAAFTESRDPLEARFEFEGRRLVAINNHLTSRYGSTPVFGAVQPWVQAGEREREAQVRALRAYAGWLVRQDPAARVVVLGDMNTFDFTDDLSVLLPGSPPLLTNLMSRVEPSQRYTYNFEGNSQALDHIFVTGNLAASAEVDVVHLNGDFPSEPAASDHDPVVARLRW